MSSSIRTFGGAKGHADQGSWTFAVPSNDEKQSPDDSTMGYNAGSFTHQRQFPQAQYIAHTHNGNGGAQYSNAGPEYFKSRQPGFSGRLKPPFQDQDRASSGNDSLIDLYRSSAGSPDQTTIMSSSPQSVAANSRKRVASRESSRVRRKGSKGPESAIESDRNDHLDENSKWIHRDKLAQIESRELAEMGIRKGRPSRAASRSKSAKTAKSAADAQETTPELQGEDDVVTQASHGQDHSHGLDPNQRELLQENSLTNGQVEPDVETFANHVSQRSQDRTPPSRPGTSRIPVPVGSYDEDAPLEMRRKRSESFNALHHRTRSRSEGSQHLLDGTNSSNTQSPQQQDSPPKQRNTSKSNISANRIPSASRKTSGANPRSRANSTTDSPRRPTTSGGPRPPTARPEGEAPWIATMYKPDPLLPPDQQMLPTHAKRLAQMQAESDVKATEDNERSEFRLVESNDDKENLKPSRDNQNPPTPIANASSGKRSSNQQLRSSMQEKRDSGQWPLRSPSQQQRNEKHLSPHLSPRPDASERGSYNLIPHVPSVNEQERRPSAQARLPQHNYNGSYGALPEDQKALNDSQAPVRQAVHLDEKPKPKKKKEGGCAACCAVM